MQTAKAVVPGLVCITHNGISIAHLQATCAIHRLCQGHHRLLLQPVSMTRADMPLWHLTCFSLVCRHLQVVHMQQLTCNNYLRG